MLKCVTLPDPLSHRAGLEPGMPARGPAVDSWNSVTANQIEAFQQLTKERKCCHSQSDFLMYLFGSYLNITPVLRSLHWLPVTFRIDFKVLLLVYKSLNGLGPKYIADMLTEYKPNRPLRSLGLSQLETPRVHTKQGECAFSYYAARSWNQLPEEIRCAKTLATFKSRLKTHLFMAVFHCMVQYGSARLGTVRYGSVRVGLHFHRSLVPL